jgi:UDP-glucose-4-epimerase GalE
MHVLVTGGAGYVGSHAAKALARAGMVPVVFDNFDRGRRDAVRWGPVVEGDLADRAAVERAFDAHPIGAVMHFAAFCYVHESMQAPGLYFRNNLANSLTLLDVMQSKGVRRIVFSSSCATYGMPARVPIAEDAPQRPVNPYGESKLAVEKALHWYGVLHGFSWAALRYFNAAGADPEVEIGEDHDPETHLIPLAIAAALGRIPHLEVYGSDYETPDGTAVRDYVHVTDLAQGHLAALRYLEAGRPSGAFNLGTGEGRSVLEVISMVQKVSGRMVPSRPFPRRPGDPPILVADPAKATRELGWKATLSSLETIIETAWKWHNRKNGHSPPKP